MAHRNDPRNSTGAREVERSETRMSGALSLWLLSARVKRHGAKRSNSRRLARRVSAANQVTRRKAETSKQSQYTCGGIPAVNQPPIYRDSRFRAAAVSW